MMLFYYTISKLLPLVLLSSLVSIVTVHLFQLIIGHSIYSLDFFADHTFIVPILGSLLLIILFYIFKQHIKSGLPHVVLNYHAGNKRLPFFNTLFQFIAATVALLTGFTVGAIGPAVHIGAGSANLVGQFFHARPSTLRVLTACGAAVAITIMFNTPLMAILFTYETIIRRFRWRTLMLVTISALFAHYLADQINLPRFNIDVMPFSVSWLFFLQIVLFGLICGLISSSFLNIIDFITHKIKANYWKKILLAGLIISLISIYFPLTIGIGNDLLQTLLYEPQALTVISIWLFIRFISASAMIALAVPGGALGPSLILGALTGAVFSQLFQLADSQVFIIVGMGALLGAVLRVPLAGILFILESSEDINLLIPCIIATYSAYFVHLHFSKQNNLIELLLARQNVILRHSPSLKKKRLFLPL